MNRLSLALVHYPVVDKNDQLYTTAITNMDVHDIARSCKTFGLDQYYLITPIKAQQELASTIKNFWINGSGKDRNRDRTQAMDLISINENIESAIMNEEKLVKEKPLIISTSAKECFNKKTISYQRGQELIAQHKSVMLIFGTGYGLASSVLENSDYLLEPIYGHEGYNHLSVRSAVAIILDRLCSR